MEEYNTRHKHDTLSIRIDREEHIPFSDSEKKKTAVVLLFCNLVKTGVV